MNESAPEPDLFPGERLVYVKEFDGYVGPPPSSIRAMEDLSGVHSAREIGENGPVLAAIPVAEHSRDAEFSRYKAVFGRDSLRVAADLIDKYPALTRSTLLTLAKLQGVDYSTQREEEPGRIIHEARDPRIDPVAVQLTEERGWDWPYYGSVDATPQFIQTLTAYCNTADEGYRFLQQRFTGRDGEIHHVADSLKNAVSWLVRRLESSPEYLLEYQSSIPGGIENQVWRDSWDGYFHADGKIANHGSGIASTEVQATAMDALFSAAQVYVHHFNDLATASVLLEHAIHLRKELMQRFWSNQRGGYFVLGADRDSAGRLRPMEIKTSDMGHLLNGSLLSGDEPQEVERRTAVVEQLFSEQMLAFSGIRTLASDEVRFRAGAYHNGSVWIWENYHISQGLHSHGYHQLADHLEERLLSVANSTGKFPEYVRGGFARHHEINDKVIDVWDETNQRINHLEQPPQDIQAWSVAAILAIKMQRGRKRYGKSDRSTRSFERRLLRDVRDR